MSQKIIHPHCNFTYTTAFDIYIKVKCPRYRPVWPRGWVEVQLYSSMTATLEGGEWSAGRPSRTLPPGKTRYPFYRRLGEPQGWSGGRKISSRTVQPVAQSLYRLSYPRYLYIATNIQRDFKQTSLECKGDGTGLGFCQWQDIECSVLKLYIPYQAYLLFINVFKNKVSMCTVCLNVKSSEFAHRLRL